MQYIIYPNNITISIVVPSSDNVLSLSEIATQTVPKGLPYKIINSEDIPSDRIFRNAWTFDFSNPDGYGGAT
jgi:hypothetical protein